MWPFHRHKWVEVGKEPLLKVRIHYFFGKERHGEEVPVTVITYKCNGCPRYKQIELGGYL